MKKETAKETDKVGSHNLVDLFFVGDVGDRRGHQGHVLAYLVNGFYLVQFFSWSMGDPTNQGVVRLEDLLQANFYVDHSQWIKAGENLSRQNMLKAKREAADQTQHKADRHRIDLRRRDLLAGPSTSPPPSQETEAELVLERQVVAIEAMADHLETLASVVEPARQSWRDPDGWAEPVSARDAYLRTGGI